MEKASLFFGVTHRKKMREKMGEITPCKQLKDLFLFVIINAYVVRERFEISIVIFKSESLKKMIIKYCHMRK